MADKEATLILKLKDLASQGLTGVGGALSKLRANFIAVTAAVSGFTAFAVSAVKAYIEQESAVNKLNVAMKNQGIFTEKASKDLQDYASALQRSTTFSDESIIETQALLVTFGLAGDVLNKTTQAALDLATGLSVDLKTATLLLGKAAVGETATLSRYGIKIDETIPPAQRLDATLEQLQKRFGGSAQAELNTTAGKLKNFELNVSELKERIGGFLIPVLDLFVKKLLVIVDMFEQLVSSAAPVSRFVATVSQLFLELGRSVFESIIKPIELLKPILEKLGIDIAEPIAAINAYFDEQSSKLENWALAAEMNATRQVQAEKVKEEQLKAMGMTRQQFLAQQALKEAEIEKKKQAELKKQRDAEFSAFDAQVKKEIEIKAKQAEKMKEIDDKRARDFQSTLSYIATLSISHNKTLGAVGKAAGIAQATMDARLAFGRALGSAPPPFNYALAAASLAVGMANVANIAGIQLAEGGIVLPRHGGTVATIGEAGRAEAVIPLDDPEAQDRMGGMGGGTLNVYIQAGTIVADEMSFNELAEKIDEKLFKLQRNRRSVAF